ncbi:hypothetical protein [Thermomonas sp.]|uniref:hypothetical protein n=1 Tax=Thermomonas sp. TaxID=1971895 RepID=UPI0025D73EC2|nr:hypothetical protein [Thermomonas sp.]
MRRPRTPTAQAVSSQSKSPTTTMCASRGDRVLQQVHRGIDPRIRSERQQVGQPRQCLLRIGAAARGVDPL